MPPDLHWPFSGWVHHHICGSFWSCAKLHSARIWQGVALIHDDYAVLGETVTVWPFSVVPVSLAHPCEFVLSLLDRFPV